MPAIRTSLRAATGFAALSLALPAAAQDETLPPLPSAPTVGDAATPAPVVPMTKEEVSALPPEYQSLPVQTDTTTTSVGVDGVETITRTRRIEGSAPVTQAQYGAQPYTAAYPQNVYYQTAYTQPASAPLVLDSDQWVAECERRTNGRNDKEKGGIIGGLLGAIGGGIAGHEIAGSGDGLAGALIGGGLGGLAGILIGNLLEGDGDDDRYDCQGVLDAYLDQNAKYGQRFAARSIPAQAVPVQTVPVQAAPPVAYPAYSYGYYPQQPVYYQPQQTMVMVPVTTYQQQRVVVRETVREELVPGAARSIPAPAPAPVPAPAPAPSPKLTKQVPAPAPSGKMIKN